MNPEVLDNTKEAQRFRDALDRVTRAEVLAASPRLVAFLTYVVEQTIEGRGAEIRGKNIAVDVYGRSLDEGGSAQNLVRVEARRLRRALEEYYAGEGAADPARIRMDVGRYAPVLHQVDRHDEEDATEALSSATRRRPISIKALVLSMVFGIVAIATAGFVIWRSMPQAEAVTNIAMAERAALRARSVPALQAANLADEARGMFFPVFEVRRQQLALDMFEYAIELDPELPSGHAGSAQVLATLSLVLPDPETGPMLLQQAQERAARAMDLAPTNAWPHAATAWVAAVAGNDDLAMKHAEIALNLAPEDGHILDLVGIASLMIGNASLAAQVSDPDRPRTGPGRFGAQNIWGVSQLMLRNYEETIEAFRRAPELGAPVSAPTVLFSAAAHRGLNDLANEARLLKEYRETWPEFPGEFLANRIFRASPDTRELILKTLSQSETFSE